jgi:F0F1-type ATP synthase assembly protein I
VLASPDIKARLAHFDWTDAIAIKERKSYRRFRLLGLWATMTGTIVGALVLLPLDELIDGWPRWTIQGLQTLALILAFIAAVFIVLRQSSVQWMQSRAVAERMRADVFRAIMRGGLLRPALACFKDAQLDWQLGYYARRGSQHRQSAGNTTPYKMFGYLLLAIAVALGLVGFMNMAAKFGLSWPPLDAAGQWVRLEQSGRWQLGLGTMASSILAFASARSFMDQDDRNASYYALAGAELERIRTTDLSSAEAAAASDNVADVMAFCEKVQAILDAEHLAWVYTRPPDVVPVVPEPKL